MGALGIENGGSDDTLAYLGIVPCSALSYWEVFVKRKRIWLLHENISID